MSILSWRVVPAAIVIAVFIAVGIASLGALFLVQTDEGSWLTVLSAPYIWRLLSFSLWQAFLSTVISIGFAIPLTSVLLHRQFIGRDLLLQLFSLSLVVPTLVAILGIVVIYGRYGLLSTFLQGIGVEVDIPLYGLFGILLAHVFFNMPLAVRILMQSCTLIPASQLRLSYQLGFSRWHVFRWIEWPYMKKSLPSIFMLIFMLCFSSFAVVLSLGGGPKSSTLEVAIYQALRYEFDIPKASLLSILQVAVCSLVAFFVYRFTPMVWQDLSLTTNQIDHTKDSSVSKIIDMSILTLALLFLLPPFVAIFTPAFSMLFIETLLAKPTWLAVWISIKIALPSMLLCLIIAFSFATVARFFIGKSIVSQRSWYWLANTLEHSGNIILMIPSLVMATGLFLLLYPLGLSFEFGYYVIVWVNAVMTLPFVLRVLLPTLYQQERRYHFLYTALKIRGWKKFKLEWPLIRASVGQASAYAVILSLGDMGVIALFGSQELLSLPLYLFQLIGSYRLEQGACIAVLLIGICLILFYFCTHFIGGKNARY
ncbi:thiamine/thiamine pyrophosphate ABC transporter, permease protein [Marinomonas agarivorans]|nr:thiamine/thiamine pyrophosphate ABC transporter, permease protein [Marinomonas agarivorans]